MLRGMRPEEIQSTRARLTTLRDRLCELGVENLEMSAAGKSPVYTVTGFLPDARALEAAAEAVRAAGPDVIDDLVTVASRWSGFVPSSFDGDPSASPARLAVRKRLDLAAHLDGEGQSGRALQEATRADALARDSGEPALMALASYAVGVYETMAGKAKPAELCARYEAVIARVEGSPAPDALLLRNARRSLEAARRKASLAAPGGHGP